MNVEIICNTIVKVTAMVLLFLFGVYVFGTLFGGSDEDRKD